MDQNILYSFRRCPYAIRARWAILITGTNVVLREVSLKKKPKELVQLSPKATVPVLLTNCGKVIDESLEIMKWALRNNNVFSNITSDTDSQINYIIEQNDSKFKYHLDRYKYSDPLSHDEKQFHKYEAKKILLEWNSRLSGNTCSGVVNGCESLADWAIWPFVRQFRLIDPACFDADNSISSLQKWLSMYLNNYRYSQLMIKVEPWQPLYKPVYFPSNLE